MKLDKIYLKGLLNAFEESSRPFTNIYELSNNGYHHDDDSFLFHMNIILDKGLIKSSSNSDGIGYSHSDNDTNYWRVVPLRLTSDGHDFISNLNEPEVWDAICDNFKDSSVDTIKSVAKDLAKRFAKNKITSLFGEESGI